MFASLVAKGYNKKFIAEMFDVSRQTVARWSKRTSHFKDKRRDKKSKKITFEIEAFILAIRNTFSWGSARIQQALKCLPEFMKKELENLTVTIVQGVKLSRQAIQDVLVKHGLNGYKHKSEGWHFFRAKQANELWQLDLKGPFILQGKKYFFVVCIDDYSRYLITAEQVDHAPTIKEIGTILEPYILQYKPLKILTDNNPFKREWNDWCKTHQVESLHAHPYYPQDKGKVERAIRNVSEEFIYLMTKFPHWIGGKIREYIHWFNHDRYHRGIRGKPADYFT